MQTHTPPTSPGFPPLEQETRSHIPTAQAAYYLGRKPQTLRKWSCVGDGLLQPHRVGVLLAWSVDDIRKLLGVPA